MNVDIIRELNAFKSVSFVEHIHRYYIEGKESNSVSVTGLISKFKPKFDTDKWSRIKAKKLGITQEEMKFIWSDKNLLSTTLGTSFHSLVEGYYTGYTHRPDKERIATELGTENYQVYKNTLQAILPQFVNFYNDTKEYLIPVRNEFIVGDYKDTQVCGTLDLLAYNERKEQFEIYDFKTNKDITRTSLYNESFKTPLDSLELCEFNTYSLQLSLYKYIIEKYTKIRISTSYIVWFNSRNANYECIPTTDLTPYVVRMLDSISVC